MPIFYIFDPVIMKATDITPQEFGRLFLEYREKFISIARSYVRDEIAAEDIVSGCFTSFWDNREKIEIEVSAEAYILQSVKNRCMNYLRDNANRLKVHETRYNAAMTRIRAMESEDLSFLFRADIQAIFTRLLDKTPEMTRNIFCSSRFEDMTYEEIAKKYNVSPRKVKREIQSVLAMMRQSLKDYLPATAVTLTLVRQIMTSIQGGI